MKYLKPFSSLTVVTFYLIIAIASQTEYKSSGFTGGFNELQLDSNKFDVSFRGNGYTSESKVIDLCLLRCAEICKEKGFDYFVIADNKNMNKSYITSNNYGVQTIHAPSTRNTIICFKGSPTNNDIVTYKPEYLIPSLKTKYNIP